MATEAPPTLWLARPGPTATWVTLDSPDMAIAAGKAGWELRSYASTNLQPNKAYIPPHEFTGRHDRDCLVCHQPDRAPIHA